jgi:hypothetical protein
MSLGTLIAFIAIVWEFLTQRRLALAGTTAAAFASDGPEPDTDGASREKPGQRARTRTHRRRRR